MKRRFLLPTGFIQCFPNLRPHHPVLHRSRYIRPSPISLTRVGMWRVSRVWSHLLWMLVLPARRSGQKRIQGLQVRAGPKLPSARRSVRLRRSSSTLSVSFSSSGRERQRAVSLEEQGPWSWMFLSSRHPGSSLLPSCFDSTEALADAWPTRAGRSSSKRGCWLLATETRPFATSPRSIRRASLPSDAFAGSPVSARTEKSLTGRSDDQAVLRAHHRRMRR